MSLVFLFNASRMSLAISALGERKIPLRSAVHWKCDQERDREKKTYSVAGDYRQVVVRANK